jgi:hypothetical protein
MERFEDAIDELEEEQPDIDFMDSVKAVADYHKDK